MSPVRAAALIPSLDSEATIGDVVQGMLEVLGHVIVVDDGSQDATADVAREAGAHVVRHLKNRGKGAALATGLREAFDDGYTHVVALDADGQHLPRDAPRLLEAAESDPSALIIGRRRLEGPHVPGKSVFGRDFSNFWVRLETGLNLLDTQSGYRVYPVRPTLALGIPPSRFEWEVEVIVKSAWAGTAVQEVDVGVYYPPPAERLTHFRGLEDVALISLLHCRLVPSAMLRTVWPKRSGGPGSQRDVR